MKKLFVSEKQLVAALKRCIDEMDADSLADLAQHALGGEIYPPSETDDYEVIKTETYGGAFD